MRSSARAATQIECEFIADELAITLTTTKVAASNRLALALSVGDHPSAAAAWRSGRLDTRRVNVICEGLSGASPIAIDALTRRWYQVRGVAHRTRSSAVAQLDVS